MLSSGGGTAAAIAMSAKSSGKGGSGKNGSSSQNAQTAGLIQRIRYAARCPPPQRRRASPRSPASAD